MSTSQALNAPSPRWLLVLVTISGTMAMHMVVPALPDAAHSRAIGTGAMGMAITIYVDAFGRRPTALGKAVSVRPQLIVSASGLYGFSQMAVGAICTAFAASGSDPAISALIVMVAATVIAQLALTAALRRDRAAIIRA